MTGKAERRVFVSDLGHRLRRAKRQAQRIFEFILGLCFMGMAAISIEAALIEWHRYVGHPSAGLFWFYACAALTVILIFFCLYSFLKARSIR